jgi:hypothetical protein
MPPKPLPPTGEIILYPTADGRSRVECRFAGETVWLTQALMAELFDISTPTVNEHLKGIYEDRELDPEATIRKFRIVRREGAREVARNLDHYSLDAILAVGEFLTFNERRLLPNAGTISKEQADARAASEYSKFEAIRRAYIEAEAEREIIAQLEDAAKQLPSGPTPDVAPED